MRIHFNVCLNRNQIEKKKKNVCINCLSDIKKTIEQIQ